MTRTLLPAHLTLSLADEYITTPCQQLKTSFAGELATGYYQAGLGRPHQPELPAERHMAGWYMENNWERQAAGQERLELARGGGGVQQSDSTEPRRLRGDRWQ
jgi:hypothetical protein